MSRVLVPFAQGVEEIEFVSVVDILRRADIDVVTAALNSSDVTGRSNITIKADVNLDDALDNDWDMIVLPGGLPNADLLRQDERLKLLVQRLHEQGRFLAAICAAPTALAAFGVVGSKRVTSYPAMKMAIQELAPKAIYVDDEVVEDGCLITSRGAGTAVAFALRLVAVLCGEEKSMAIRTAIVA
jgi:4-methyl-5(b-hydroxyethyl)-thiazole monophosphate biosynthesis